MSLSSKESGVLQCVLERVQSDPLAADLTLSLFAAAVHSYRHDSVLRPFPPAFIKGGLEKDRKALVRNKIFNS